MNCIHLINVTMPTVNIYRKDNTMLDLSEPENEYISWYVFIYEGFILVKLKFILLYHGLILIYFDLPSLKLNRGVHKTLSQALQNYRHCKK